MAEETRPQEETGSVKTKKMGLGLGYFSLALGAMEVAAPGRLARFLGLEGNDTARKTIFAFGLRELAAGGMLLRGPAVSTNVWNRVIGDAMDATALGLAMRNSTRKGAVAGALAFVGGAAVADVLTARALDRPLPAPSRARPGGRESENPGILKQTVWRRVAKLLEVHISGHDVQPLHADQVGR